MRYYALAERPWIEEDPGGGGYWGLPPGTIGSVDLAPLGSTSHVFVTSDAPFDAGDVAVVLGDGTRLDTHVLTSRERNAWADLTGDSVPSGATLLDALWNILTIHADPSGLTRCKPIMPTRRGVLELHLGGHSLVRAEKLPEDPTLHPAWGVMQRVLRNDYRAVQSRDETLARKWLGAQRIKYRLSEERVSELLIDDDLERVPPLRPTTTITDDFNRADQTGLGQSAEGWSWTSGGTANIESNLARINNSAWSRAEIDLSSDDQMVTVDAASGQDFGRVGPACRVSSTQETYYAGSVQRGNSLARLSKWIDGTGTIITFGTVTFSNGDRLGVIADGSTIIFEINGTPIFTETDTEISGHLRTGLARASGGSSAAQNFFDDFEAADLLADEGDVLVRLRAEAVGTGDDRVRARAMARARADALALAEASARVRERVRRRAEAVGMAEAGLFVRALTRLRARTVAIAETTVSVLETLGDAVIRTVAEAAGVAETVARSRRLARTRGEMMGIAATIVRIGGDVRTASAAMIDRTRMAVGAARRLIVPPAKR